MNTPARLIPVEGVGGHGGHARAGGVLAGGAGVPGAGVTVIVAIGVWLGRRRGTLSAPECLPSTRECRRARDGRGPGR